MPTPDMQNEDISAAPPKRVSFKRSLMERIKGDTSNGGTPLKDLSAVSADPVRVAPEGELNGQQHARRFSAS
ncbi:hypothetical protein QR680_003192 [Steinernema hermaphroditum]|uniref:Uncharacterized protein n=1 Tax=Steinernema hermaphroditum TaxID=289476 RepID=A0AA39H7Y3_9BILA|nr:hypothetical protein QR680_003192 [Steinernema hermaphroditum]